MNETVHRYKGHLVTLSLTLAKHVMILRNQNMTIITDRVQ